LTLNAVFRVDDHPVLLSDFVVTAPGSERDHIELPTHADLQTLIPREYLFPVVRLASKVLEVSPRLLVCGSGSLLEIRRVFTHLHGRFSTIEATTNAVKSSLCDYIEERGDGSPDCVIAGWIIDAGQPVSFRWSSETGDVETEGDYIEGSGARIFRELCLPLANTAINPDELERGLAEAALHMTTTPYANELVLGNTLLNGFGGGYDAFVFANGRFRRVHDVTYLLFAVRVIDLNTLRIGQMPILLKNTSFGQHTLLRSFLIPSLDKRIKARESEAIALVTPVYVPARPTLPSTPFIQMPLTSANFAIGMFGKAIDHADEIFTAIVTAPAETSLFRIQITDKVKDGKNEVVFALPEKIMMNISAQAFLRFSRQTVEGVQSRG
jgi:hypothetical protein